MILTFCRKNVFVSVVVFSNQIVSFFHLVSIKHYFTSTFVFITILHVLKLCGLYLKSFGNNSIFDPLHIKKLKFFSLHI